MSIGLALSNDGVHWGRLEGDYASGAILEQRHVNTAPSLSVISCL